MSITTYSDEEVVSLGKERYEKELRSQLETPENRGRLVALDIETGDYEMGHDSLEVVNALMARKPESHIYLLRIGRPTAISMGGWK